MEAIFEANEPRKLHWKTIASVVTVLFILLGSIGIYTYVYTQRPDIYNQVKLKLSRFGFSEQSPQEVQRVSDINRLSISYEEKQILINRTIFMGATPRMVMLALGKPKEGHRMLDKAANKEVIILVYHLPEELRPTMLRFEENKLVEAKKGSSIDYTSTPVPYTGMNSE